MRNRFVVHEEGCFLFLSWCFVWQKRLMLISWFTLIREWTSNDSYQEKESSSWSSVNEMMGVNEIREVRAEVLTSWRPSVARSQRHHWKQEKWTTQKESMTEMRDSEDEWAKRKVFLGDEIKWSQTNSHDFNEHWDDDRHRGQDYLWIERYMRSWGGRLSSRWSRMTKMEIEKENECLTREMMENE